MKPRSFLYLVSIVLLVLACNLPLSAVTVQNTGSNPSGASSPPPVVAPTDTTVPATAPVVPTPSTPQATPNTTAVNCRSGPDVGYDAKDTINQGQVAQITGRNDDSSWWYVIDPNNTSVFCWVSASVVTTAGNLTGLPVITPPTGIVTNVTVAAKGSFTMCGGPNVVEFSGAITTNGPAKVQFQWEIRGDKSNTTSPQTLTFKAAGTKSAPDPGAYTADCGHYSITLHVIDPNDTSATKKFSIP